MQSRVKESVRAARQREIYKAIKYFISEDAMGVVQWAKYAKIL